jgi:thiamine kinase-like enzyme
VFCVPDSNLGGSSVAEAVARVLAPRGRDEESIIHGDVKSENLFARGHGEDDDDAQVAFFDFQYVGLGLGACDLAKLFTCSIPPSMLGDDAPPKGASRGARAPRGMTLPMGSGERSLLQQYHSDLVSSPNAPTYEWDTFVRHWETALVDWCRFQASWGFWGNTAWLSARVRHVLADEGWRAWLVKEDEAARKGL